MPFTNNPDQFFLSGGDPTVLQALIAEIRMAMLSLNKYNPGNGSSIISVETLQRFAKLKLIASNYQALSKFRMTQVDAHLKDVKQDNLDIANQNIDNSRRGKTAQNNLINTEIGNLSFAGTVSKGSLLAKAVMAESVEQNNLIKKQFDQMFHRDKLHVEKWDQAAIRDLLKQDNFVDALFSNVVTELQKDFTYHEKVGADRSYGITKAPRRDPYYGHTAKSIFVQQKRQQAAKDGTVLIGGETFPVHGQPYDNYSAAISDDMSTASTFLTDSVDTTPATQAKSGPKMIFRGWGVQQKDGTWVPDPMRTFTKDTPFSDVITNIVKSNMSSDKAYVPPGSVRFFIEKLHGRYADGTPYKTNGVITPQRDPIGKTNFSNRMIFAAYIDNFNDQYSPQWNQYDFLGRAESVPVYKQTKRTMTLTFSIVADYSKDLMLAMENIRRQLNYQDSDGQQLENIIKATYDYGRGFIGTPQPSYDENGNPKRFGGHIPGMYSDTPESLWHKLTFLAQCNYPYYRPDGKMKEQPIIRVRVADFYDVTAYIENFQVDLNEFDHMIDLNPSAIGHIPFSVKVTLGLGIIHAAEPNSDFWGFYNRHEFDTGAADPQTGIGLAKDGDSTKAVQKKSPASFAANVMNEGMLDTPNVLKTNFDSLKTELSTFSMKFDDFKKVGINTKDEDRRQAAQDAMKAYTRVMMVSEQLYPYFGLQSPVDIDFSSGMADKLGNISGSNSVTSSFKSNLDASNTAKKGNFIAGVKNQYENVKNKYNMTKEKYDLVYGNAMGIIDDTIRTVNQVNTQLKQVGVDLPKNDTIENTVNKAKELAPYNLIPKTIGEILNKHK